MAESTPSDAAMQRAYLGRLGLADDEASALARRAPNAADLGALLSASLHNIPFENLGQHEHAAGRGVPALSRPGYPTLNVRACLDKLVHKRRGGFCFEVNFCFAWLLRSLGYRVRLGRSDVMTPGGPVIGHMVLFIDGLGPASLLVDPGFGDAVRAPVPVRGAATDASLGETYALEPYAWAGRREPAGLEGRFSHVLTRARSTGGATALLDIIDAPFPLGPSRARAVYALHVDDDLGFDAAEFADGLAAVLSEAAGNLFASKRICALGTPAGHLTLGRDYLKVVERGREVRRVALPDEAAWREALSTYFGIVLRRVAPVRESGEGRVTAYPHVQL